MEKGKLWFRAKRYGWGWVPCSWEGWLAIIVYLIVLGQFIAFSKDQHYSSTDELISFFVSAVVPTGLLIWLCYIKGETPRWRWGNKQK